MKPNQGSGFYWIRLEWWGAYYTEVAYWNQSTERWVVKGHHTKPDEVAEVLSNCLKPPMTEAQRVEARKHPMGFVLNQSGTLTAGKL